MVGVTLVLCIEYLHDAWMAVIDNWNIVNTGFLPQDQTMQ